jgi:hypothetical protein
LEIEGSRPRVSEDAGSADIEVTVEPERLPLPLLGRQSLADLYLQNALALSGEGRAEGLRVLEALFPRRPLFLPRAQWW